MPYSIESKIDFGLKHDGELVEDVIFSDPQYIWWCINNVNYFKLDEDAMAIFEGRHEDQYFFRSGNKNKKLRKCRCKRVPRIFKSESDPDEGIGMGFYWYRVECLCGMRTVSMRAEEYVIDVWNGKSKAQDT